MQTTPQNIDLLLPYGEALRGFMEQGYIAPTDLKRTVRARGVFLGGGTRSVTRFLSLPAAFSALRSSMSSESSRKTERTTRKR
jgi:hypothetical protein